MIGTLRQQIFEFRRMLKVEKWARWWNRRRIARLHGLTNGMSGEIEFKSDPGVSGLALNLEEDNFGCAIWAASTI